MQPGVQPGVTPVLQPATDQKDAKKSTQDAKKPYIDTKTRKCTDVFCTIIFIAFWVLLIVIVADAAKQKIKNGNQIFNLVFAYVRPGDKLRRMCGYAKADQPDVYATDYSDIIWSSGAMKEFCLLLGNSTANCSDISNASTARPFFDSLNVKYADMTNFPYGLSSFSESVCIPQQAGCTKIPADATYVCHRELTDIVTSFNSKYHYSVPQPANFPFVTDSELAGINAAMIIHSSDLSFVQNFCLELPIFNGTADAYGMRTDFFEVPLLNISPINSHLCMQNLTVEANAAVGGLKSNPVASQIINFFNDIVSNFVIEMRVQWRMIVISCVCCIVFAYLTLLLMRILVCVIVWIIILALIAGAGLGAAYFLYQALQMENENAYRMQVYGYVDPKAAKNVIYLKVFGSILAIIAGVVLIFTCCFGRSIMIGIAVIEVSTDCLRKMFHTTLLPIFWVPIVVCHCIWTIGAAFVYNCTGVFDVKYNMYNFITVAQDDKTKLFTQTTQSWNLLKFVYIVFGVFWGLFFLYACLQYVFSSLVTQWYFSDQKSTKRFLRNALKMLFKQVGTLVFTSFFVALIVWIRWLFEYVYKRVMRNKALSSNKTIKIIAWVIRIGLRCLQKFIEYTSRSAQALATITGENYCKSIKKALEFEGHNMASVIVIAVVGNLFLFLSKLVIATLAALECYLLCVYQTKNPTMFISPTFITFIISFMVAYYVIEILELMVDTIFMSFLYEENFMVKLREESGTCYAPERLKKLIKWHGDYSTGKTDDTHHERGCCGKNKQNGKQESTLKNVQ